MARLSSGRRAARGSAAALILSLLVAASHLPAVEPPPYPVLDSDGQPLRAGFNRDASRLRLLLILDPT